ncbi:MAG: hypothetical protein ACOVOP_05495, partial [Candidatus Planktophila sp.]
TLEIKKRQSSSAAQVGLNLRVNLLKLQHAEPPCYSFAISSTR